jgi:hypothetical protein
MPAKMRKIRNKNKYRVTDNKGHVHAKSTTRKKAEAQVRILKGRWATGCVDGHKHKWMSIGEYGTRNGKTYAKKECYWCGATKG